MTQQSAASTKPRVAITGLGAVTAQGATLDAILDQIAAGVSGVARVAGSETGAHTWTACAQTPYLRAEAPSSLESQVKFLSGSGLLATEASVQAMAMAAEAGLDLDAIAPTERSLYLAQVDSFDWDGHTFHAGWTASARTQGEDGMPDRTRLNKETTRRTKPFFLLESLKNNAYSLISAWFAMQGPNSSTAGIGHSAHGAFDMAWRAIQRGSTRLALVAGGNITTHTSGRVEYAAHDLLDASGKGRVPAEGGGAMLLQPEGDAPSGDPLGWLAATYATHGEATPEGATPETLQMAVEGAVAEAGGGIAVHTVVGLAGSRLEAIREAVPALAEAESLATRDLHGDLGATSDIVEAAILLRLLPPGAYGLVLQDGVYGQAGATLIQRAEG